MTAAARPENATGLAGSLARARRDQRLAALLAAAAAGDARAFETFFDATSGYARALARRILSGADLEDALADAYFNAWRHAARFEPARGSAVTWLLTIVRSRALDLLRQRPPSTGQHSDGAGQIDDDTADPDQPGRQEGGDGPAEQLWRSESQQQLHRALAALSASERWVLGLAYFRELPHGAIAAATGLPLGSVKSLILRAQHKLREQLAR